MVDKKKAVVKIASKKPMESKRDRFLRIAKKRTQNVLKSLDLLGNCGNRNNYEYNDDDVSKMLSAIHNAFEVLKSKYADSKKESMRTFDF
jgi:hypothetical protein